MKKILNKPYPFLFSLKRNLIIAVVVGGFVGFLNSLRLDENFVQQYLLLPKIQISYIFGLITFFSIILVLHFFIQIFISEKTKEDWTILKELGLISFLLFVIIAFNYSFIIFISKDTSEFLSITFFLKIIVSAFSTGLIISAFVLWINYTIILKENFKQTILLNKKLEDRLKNKQKHTKDIIVNIPSNIQNENISFNIEQLLFIKSDGNYIEVYIKRNNEIKIFLYRASIQNIQEKLADYPFIFRTHRTYLVNIKNISFTKGNARNYQLYFDKTKMHIPVARSRFTDFNKAITAHS